MENDNNSFVIYRAFIDAARDLDSVSFQEFILNLGVFALEGKDTHSSDPVVEALLTMAKPNIEAATMRHKRAVENGSKGKEFGYLGGRRRKGETYEEYRERRIRETEKTHKKPLNIDIDNDINIKMNKEKNKEINIKIDNNINKEYRSSSSPLSGSQTSEETITVSKGQLDSISLSIGSKQTIQDPGSHESTIIDKAFQALSNEELDYREEMRGYLTTMAEYSLGLIQLQDFDDVFERAICCHMEHSGVSRAKAAKDIEQGISNYEEGIQKRREREREERASCVNDNDEDAYTPF